MTPREMVTEFHQAFGVAINQPLTDELTQLRASLIIEEAAEWHHARISGSQLDKAQELADLAYVTVGTAVTFGIDLIDDLDWTTQSIYREVRFVVESLHDREMISCSLTVLLNGIYQLADRFCIDLDAAIAEVHRANMSKLGDDGKPVLRADGKVLKGPNYRPPDLSVALCSTQA